MELNGKIIKVLPLQSGKSKNGEWKKQEFVVETPGQYPKKVCFNLWGDKADGFQFSENDEVTVSFDVESREYNGRWYTDARAWKVETSGTAPSGDQPPAPSATDAPPPESDNGNMDDLPF